MKLIIIICAALWSALIYHDVIERVYAKLTKVDGDSIMQIEQRAELALHAAFYGPAVAALLGFHDDKLQVGLVSVPWAWLCIWYARKLAERVEEDKGHEARLRWRKFAGMVRSIVKSEVTRKAKEDKSSGCK